MELAAREQQVGRALSPSGRPRSPGTVAVAGMVALALAMDPEVLEVSRVQRLGPTQPPDPGIPPEVLAALPITASEAVAERQDRYKQEEREGHLPVLPRPPVGAFAM